MHGLGRSAFISDGGLRTSPQMSAVQSVKSESRDVWLVPTPQSPSSFLSPPSLGSQQNPALCSGELSSLRRYSPGKSRDVRLS